MKLERGKQLYFRKKQKKIIFFEFFNFKPLYLVNRVSKICEI